MSKVNVILKYSSMLSSINSLKRPMVIYTVDTAFCLSFIQLSMNHDGKSLQSFINKVPFTLAQPPLHSKELTMYLRSFTASDIFALRQWDDTVQ